MSTRGLIARARGRGFRGVYHHWDSYPSGLGNALFQIRNGPRFRRNTNKMLTYLINRHPAGWSTIARMAEKGRATRNSAYKGSGSLLSNRNAASSGVEYAYVFRKNGNMMDIFSSYNAPNKKMIGMFGSGNPKATWKKTASINLNKRPPNWKMLDEISR